MTTNPFVDFVKVPLGGLPVIRANLSESADSLIKIALQRRTLSERPFFSTSANGNVLALCQRSAEFRDLMLTADHIDADGMPLVMYSKLRSKTALPERVATTDLIKIIAARAQEAGVSFYLLGGKESINSAAVAQLRREFPDLIIKGSHHGYFGREMEDAVVAEIVECMPDILWVGLGVPLEHQFVRRNHEKLSGIGVIKTCGGLFEFLSGEKRRAPRWMQAVGLEWFHRMMLEPRRLTGRYLTTNPIALYALIFKSKAISAVPQKVALPSSVSPEPTID